MGAGLRKQASKPISALNALLKTCYMKTDVSEM